MSYGWEGNRMPDVTDLSRRTEGLGTGDEHPTFTPSSPYLTSARLMLLLLLL